MKAKPEPKTRRAGRPSELPAGASNRTIRMTPEEWQAVKEFLKKMRTKSPQNQGE